MTARGPCLKRFFRAAVLGRLRGEEGKQVTPDNYPASTGLQPGGRDLGGMTDIDYRKFDLDYPDHQ